MNSLAEMAGQQNLRVEFDADLDRAEQQIGQDVCLVDKAWLCEKVQMLNDVQELLDRAEPKERATLERAMNILKRDYFVSLKVYNDPKLRAALEIVGWRWAKLVS